MNKTECFCMNTLMVLIVLAIFDFNITIILNITVLILFIALYDVFFGKHENEEYEDGEGEYEN